MFVNLYEYGGRGVNAAMFVLIYICIFPKSWNCILYAKNIASPHLQNNLMYNFTNTEIRIQVNLHFILIKSNFFKIFFL